MTFDTGYAMITTRTNDASSTATAVAQANYNLAQQDVATRHPFSWLISTGTIATVASQQYSDISSNIADVWKILNLREEDTPQLLTAISRKQLETLIADDNTTTEEPDLYCDEYNDRVYWYHKPDAIYTIYCTYWKKLSDLSAGETSVIPSIYHEVLVLGGWYRQLQYKKMYAEAEAIRAEYEAFINKMVEDDEDRTDLVETQAKHIIGRPTVSGVQLPNQYRRY